MQGTVAIGILRIALHVPGARSLKDRRRVVVSLRDRIRSRFDVSCHDVSGHDLHQRATLLVTTGGLEHRVLRGVLDRVRSVVEANPSCLIVDVLDDVRSWPDAAPWEDDDV